MTAHEVCSRTISTSCTRWRLPISSTLARSSRIRRPLMLALATVKATQHAMRIRAVFSRAQPPHPLLQELLVPTVTSSASASRTRAPAVTSKSAVHRLTSFTWARSTLVPGLQFVRHVLQRRPHLCQGTQGPEIRASRAQSSARRPHSQPVSGQPSGGGSHEGLQPGSSSSLP